MQRKTILWLILIVIIISISVWIYSLVSGSIPYDDSAKIFSATISIDSIWTVGPTATIYDKSSRKSYWIKSYSSFEAPDLQALKFRKANIRYMKFLSGPFSNRIVRMEVDSVVIIDQVVSRE